MVFLNCTKVNVDNVTKKAHIEGCISINLDNVEDFYSSTDITMPNTEKATIQKSPTVFKIKSGTLIYVAECYGYIQDLLKK